MFCVVCTPHGQAGFDRDVFALKCICRTLFLISGQSDIVLIFFYFLRYMIINILNYYMLTAFHEFSMIFAKRPKIPKLLHYLRYV